MSEALDPLESLEAYHPQELLEPDPSAAASASLTLDAEEPVLGPVGQWLLIAFIVVLALAFIISTVWLLGYLAYTNPPVPGVG